MNKEKLIKIWNSIDNLFWILSKILITIFIVIVLFLITYKNIIGEVEMHEDYYNKKHLNY